uniref:DUF1758 domain-containing protein n=1 Tax=Wuchereria bancrofti TaxID=6293 RepID=A0AAF5PKS5_WUCBA
MSSHIIASFQPAKERLVSLLKEVNQLEIKFPDPNMTIEEKEDFYVIRKRVQWRQFWSSFNAAVHTQAIPEIQKLNYLYSCLKGKALQAISGYDIAPENYEVIRRLLNEKYGDHSIVTTLLYNELQSIKRNEREWIGTIENIERVLCQLEALGESLEHSNIEILIESKLPLWILNKIYKHKKKDMPWSILKLRNFLTSLVNVNEQIRNCQYSLTQLNIKSTTTKPEQKQRYNPGGTSALSTIKDNQNTSKTTTTKRRPCVFCNQDHWDSDCVNYTTLNARLSRLKVLKKCTICLRDSHKGQNCNVKKQCFYCKSSHNSALCNKRNSLSLNNTMSQRNEEHERIGPSKRKDCSTSLYNSTLTTRSKQTKETLLLCKEIKVFNPSQPQLQQNALALFDIGSQLSFISKKLSRQLKLTETETQIMRIAPFGMKEPKSCPTARIQLNVLTTESEIIPLQANIIDYLTNELQVVETSNEFQIQNLTNYWKKPDVLIGADYFFKFISLREIKELKSGHMLVQSKVGPMIVGSGDIKKLCKNELYPKEVVYSTNTNINSELENFWKLETIGIQESPQDDDDDQALKHFKRTIIKQGKRYQVCWPWKDSKQKLSNNYGLCLGRLKNLINRLQHNSNLHSYHQILMDQLHSGIIEEVPPKDEVGVIHYLPHHEVLTPSKSTTKLRIVYDASAHHKGFKSLNEVLYRGPVIYYPCDTETMDRKKFNKEDYPTIHSLPIRSIGSSRSYNDQT